MSDIQHFFKTIDLSSDNFSENQLKNFISSYTSESDFPDLDNIDIAIVGVCEDRRAYTNIGCALAPNKVRDYLYSLYPGSFRPRIADLGNICGSANGRSRDGGVTNARLEAAVCGRNSP